ncbi:MAG: ribosomal protein S18-alanine N-acetyltransferase [Oscillospiraceae bacterium]|nr:ribosomal protein S18-alanine N-acetyltransferase [Oscillospiraceae bacterium]
MQARHIAAVAALEKECFSMPWSEKSVAGELDNPLSVWLVAEENGVLAGYIGSQTVLGEADMMNVAVSPAYRRRGVGTRLVLQLIRALDARGAYQLTLEVRASNAGAIALYEALGFALAGRRPGYYAAPKEDALILKKQWREEHP